MIVKLAPNIDELCKKSGEKALLPLETYKKDFNPNRLYIVCEIQNEYIRLIPEYSQKQREKRYFLPLIYLYPIDSFDIVEETIPSEWFLLLSREGQTLSGSATELGLSKYSELINDENVRTYPQNLGLGALALFCQRDPLYIDKCTKYANEILAEQNRLNESIGV